jgi:hypothetical protein
MDQGNLSLSFNRGYHYLEQMLLQSQKVIIIEINTVLTCIFDTNSCYVRFLYIGMYRGAFDN